MISEPRRGDRVFRVVSAAPSGAVNLNAASPPTAHAVGYFLLPLRGARSPHGGRQGCRDDARHNGRFILLAPPVHASSAERAGSIRFIGGRSAYDRRVRAVMAHIVDCWCDVPGNAFCSAARVVCSRLMNIQGVCSCRTRVNVRRMRGTVDASGRLGGDTPHPSRAG
jgi:hypothetical protein